MDRPAGFWDGVIVGMGVMGALVAIVLAVSGAMGWL